MRNYSGRAFSIRIAAPAELDAVSALLLASYSTLLRACYDDGILAGALPHLTKANPTLLACGSYYVAEREPGNLVGCGGWTAAKPGSGEVTEGEAHIRHFATHPEWARRGIGSALLARCISDARSAGVRKLHCISTLNAEQFYRAAGFEMIETIDVPLEPGMTFPGISMSCEVCAWDRHQMLDKRPRNFL